MTYTITPSEKSTVDIEMTFVDDEVDDAISDAYLAIRGKYTVPGFRKGKAPKNILMNYIGMRPFYDEAIDKLFSAGYSEVMGKEKENYPFVGSPSGDITELEEKKIVLLVNQAVEPDIAISQYTGIKIPRVVIEVTDEDVENEIKRISQSSSVATEVSDRNCALGDTVNIDFVGCIDGVAFPGGTADDYDLELGSGSFIPGFEEQVVGLGLGETRSFDVRFPDDYMAEDMAGKDATFTVTVNKITEKKYPEMDESFAKKYGGCDTMEDFREKTRIRLTGNAARESRNRTENNIVDAILKYCEAEIPVQMTEEEIDSLVRRFEGGLVNQGITLDEYLKYMGQEMDDFRNQFTESAEKNCMTRLMMKKIIEKENITVRPGQLDEKITEQAESIGKTYEEYKDTIEPAQVEYIMNDILISNLFEFLTENNEMYDEKNSKDDVAENTDPDLNRGEKPDSSEIVEESSGVSSDEASGETVDEKE